MSTFTPFPLLPFELRNKIWTLSSTHPHPLKIHINITSVPSQHLDPNIKIKTIYKLTPLPPHPLLLTNHESRTIYDSLTSSVHLPSFPDQKATFIPKLDTIYLDVLTLFHLASPGLFDSLWGCGWGGIENLATSLMMTHRENPWKMTGMSRVGWGVLSGLKGKVGVIEGKEDEVLKGEMVEMWMAYWNEALSWEGVRGSAMGEMLEGNLRGTRAQMLADQFFEGG